MITRYIKRADGAVFVWTPTLAQKAGFTEITEPELRVEIAASDKVAKSKMRDFTPIPDSITEPEPTHNKEKDAPSIFPSETEEAPKKRGNPN